MREKFGVGRGDRLEELLLLSQLAGTNIGEQVKLYKFYHKSRKDGLASRESRDWQIRDTFIG